VSRVARLWPVYLVCAGLTTVLIVLWHFNPHHLVQKMYSRTYWTLSYLTEEVVVRTFTFVDHEIAAHRRHTDMVDVEAMWAIGPLHWCGATSTP
jgi:peptidoglycan/LPS O-acetylase OafA/YrhL